MVADTGIGWNYQVAINLTDANGSPLEGAPSAGGTLNLYGPASATVVVYTDTVADLGNGDYGLTIDGSYLGAAGWYRWEIPTITVGGYEFEEQAGGFSVGVIPPEIRTLRAVVVAVVQALRLGVASRTTGAGTTTTLVDSRWVDAGLATNELVGCELVILEPGGATDANPVRVTASNHGTGTLTFTPAITAVGSGVDYILIRRNQAGLGYDEVLEAIVAAVADVATRQPVTDAVTLTTTRGTREYTLPDSWLDINRIEIARQPTAWDPYWETVPPIYYDLWPDRRTIFLKADFGAEYLLRLSGTVGVAEPRDLGALVKVPWTAARDLAVAYLSLPPQQRAGLAMRRATLALGRRAG
jgi:hypothetical protein